MRYPGDWIIALLIVAPTVAAMVIGWGPPDGAGAWLAFAGRITGVAGLACLLTAGMLCVRVPGFDRPFGGLTRLWKQHHYLGLASFLLLLAHPPLMALSWAVVMPSAMVSVLIPAPGELAMWAGWLALLAMMVFLAPSFQFFGLPEYQRWKGLHFLAGVALIGGVLHAIPLTRTMSFPAAALMWGLLGGIAVLVFAWRALLARPLIRRKYRVTATRPLADRVVEISLTPDGGRPLAHAPGQFIYFTPHDLALTAGRDEEHPFTISSAPGDDHLHIAVRDLGDATHALQRLTVGTAASVEGPYGLFMPEKHRDRPQLWIGGGIGIAPFLGTARAMARGVPWGDTVLINCANDPVRAYCLEELKAIAAARSGLLVYPHYFLEEGPLQRDFVETRCADAPNRDWYVCGPPELVKVVRGIARELGVPRSRLHAEEFNFL